MILLTIIICISIVVVTAYCLTPLLLVRFVNRKLGKIKGYRCAVRRARLRLMQGKVIFYDASCVPVKNNSPGVSTFTVYVPILIVHISIRSLLNRRLKATITYRNAIVDIFQHTAGRPLSLERAYGKMHNRIQHYLNFTVTLAVENCSLNYRNDLMKEDDPIRFSNLSLTFDNITNNLLTQNPTTLSMDALVFGGTLHAQASVDPVAVQPTFHAQFNLGNAELKSLNPFLRKYLRFDVHAGEFDVSGEVNVINGSLEGYVEPVVCAVQVRGREDEEKSFLNKLWEWGVSMAIKGFGKGKRDRISLRVPLTGSLDTAHIALRQLMPVLISKIFHPFVPIFRS